MDVGFQLLDALDVLGLFGEEGIEGRLVLAGGVDAALDAELAERFDEAEAGKDDADGADDGGRVGDDLVAGGGDEVAARGRSILDEDDAPCFSCSSARSRMRLAMRRDCTGEPPGELIDDGDGRAAFMRESALQERGDARRC